MYIGAENPCLVSCVLAMIATRATVATLFKRQRNCFKLSSHSVKPAYPSESVLASCSLALVRAQIRARAFSPSPVRRDDEDDQQQRAQWSELLKQRQSIRNHNYRASQPKGKPGCSAASSHVPALSLMKKPSSATAPDVHRDLRGHLLSLWRAGRTEREQR